jgi:hypothetical protein
MYRFPGEPVPRPERSLQSRERQGRDSDQVLRGLVVIGLNMIQTPLRRCRKTSQPCLPRVARKSLCSCCLVSSCTNSFGPPEEGTVGLSSGNGAKAFGSYSSPNSPPSVYLQSIRRTLFTRSAHKATQYLIRISAHKLFRATRGRHGWLVFRQRRKGVWIIFNPMTCLELQLDQPTALSVRPNTSLD